MAVVAGCPFFEGFYFFGIAKNTVTDRKKKYSGLWRYLCLENEKNYTNTYSLSSIIAFTSSISLLVAMAICSMLKLL